MYIWCTKKLLLGGGLKKILKKCFLFDQWRKSLLKNESMSWMGSIDSKKMKESFLLSRKYFQSLTSFTFLGKNIKSLCMLSKKRSILLVWFLSFPNFAFNENNDFAFNIINSKKTTGKKRFLIFMWQRLCG